MLPSQCMRRLRCAPQEPFFNEMLREIVKYRNYFRDKWVTWGVEGAVDTLFKTHGVTDEK